MPLSEQLLQADGKNMLERIGDVALAIAGRLFSILMPAWVWIALFVVLGIAIVEFA